MLLWWFFYDSLKKHCGNSEDFEVRIIDRICFFVLVSETLTFLGASVMIVWWLFEETITKQQWFWCEQYWSLSLLSPFIPKHWWILAASLMFIEATFMKHWRPSFNYSWPQMFSFFFANLRNIDISLMLQWCFVDASVREPLWNSDGLNANKNDHLRFFSANLWIFDVSLLLHWIFFDESSKKF